MRKAFIIPIVLLFSGSTFGQSKDTINSRLAFDYWEKSLALERDNQIEKAIATIDSAIFLDASNHWMYSDKSEMLRSVGKYMPAAEALLKAVNISGTFDSNPKGALYGVYLHIGIQYEKGGDTLSAQRYYRKGKSMFEERRSLAGDEFFQMQNDLDYAMLLLLTGDQNGWNRAYKELKMKYGHASDVSSLQKATHRDELRDLYFKRYGG
ncbi:MAG: hypothetical protein EOP04_07215 [Proteobacteria bacterium]|nr:MAG: hypothetical protein EOP04_07215 [Pseudomonadota bacterium]